MGQLPCHQLKVGDVCISLSHCNNNNSSTSTASEAEQMRPPPPPHELYERRRSNSASPSDKLLLKRAAASVAGCYAGMSAGGSNTNSPSPLAGRPKSSTLGFQSPTKQVAFAERPILLPRDSNQIL